jgi:hypothetical protein
MAQVAIYMQEKYAKRSYKKDGFAMRLWPGVLMLKDALERSGIDVDFCDKDTVGKFRVILVSLTAPIDYYSFVAERRTWRNLEYRVLVEGAGLTNIRPILWAADVFVFGRAEDLIVELVTAELAGDRLTHPSICYADSFAPDGGYQFAQAWRPYPHAFNLSNGKPWKETSIGCRWRCLFCGYTWHRRDSGAAGQKESGDSIRALGGSGDELTMMDLGLSDVAELDSLRIIGLDGMSERLRLMSGKPIDRNMLMRFLMLFLLSGKSILKKMYNIVGLPTESDADVYEMVEMFRIADRVFQAKHGVPTKRPLIVIHSTPFGATPGTPSACWPESRENRRHWTASASQRVRSDLKYDLEKSIYEGTTLGVACSHWEESLPTAILRSLAFRGEERHTDAMIGLATDKKFQAMSSGDKVSELDQRLDIDWLLGEFKPETLPTRYLQSYAGGPSFYQGYSDKASLSKPFGADEQKRLTALAREILADKKPKLQPGKAQLQLFA